LSTQACGRYELELEPSQDRIAHPRLKFVARSLAM
ncbi:pyridoxal kinase, partial [Pseudomonas aeruginosa]